MPAYPTITYLVRNAGSVDLLEQRYFAALNQTGGYASGGARAKVIHAFQAAFDARYKEITGKEPSIELSKPWLKVRPGNPVNIGTGNPTVMPSPAVPRSKPPTLTQLGAQLDTVSANQATLSRDFAGINESVKNTDARVGALTAGVGSPFGQGVGGGGAVATGGGATGSESAGGSSWGILLVAATAVYFLLKR